MEKFQFKDLLEIREDAQTNSQLSKNELETMLNVGNETSFDQDKWELFSDLDGIIGVEFKIMERFN
ncbi:MAG: hypothetical protein EOP04_15115 [Proteobacteria bacterium]|nr:MAG: hypothetical protein EOP04_15115 [Pseudomonadota bacterium]